MNKQKMTTILNPSNRIINNLSRGSLSHRNTPPRSVLIPPVRPPSMESGNGFITHSVPPSKGVVESPTSFSNHRVTIGCKKPLWHDDRRRRRRKRSGPRIHPPHLAVGTTETPFLLPSRIRTKMCAPIAANVMNSTTTTAKAHPRRGAFPRSRVNPSSP
ncbi:hypothetical protein TanjilG_11083 [Lupinus angustifolius]|uniref:Uncharacterized protein n=1 Tax=Lupinus angustifolius TaxID=3871 RepID=A0A1J7FZD2_LUPAN|nr:hypothetical protein TanjilG_11083 [Lupinus angustifolius]